MSMWLYLRIPRTEWAGFGPAYASTPPPEWIGHKQGYILNSGLTIEVFQLDDKVYYLLPRACV